MRTIFIFLIPVFFTLNSFAQGNNSPLQEKEGELSQLLTTLRSSKADTSIDEINKKFKEKFKEALEMTGAFEYPFSSLKTVGSIYSDDQLVRIFTWNVQYKDLSNNYFSFILKKDKRGGDIDVIELKRQDQHIKMLQHETLNNENWYGALYYDIIDVQRRNRTFYTLLGYDYNNPRSRIKFIDVLYFTGKTPNFGYPLFKKDNDRAMRVLFEYSSEAVMSLRYDKDRQLIIFDHLSPKTAKLKEFREFYVPDMSYDAYSWDGKYWNLKEDVIANNSALAEQKKIELKAYDADLDTVVSIPENNKWINPSDPNAPIDGGQHRAVTPDDLNKESDGKNSTKVMDNREKTIQPPRDPKSKHKSVSYSHLDDRIGKKPKKQKKKKKK